MNYIKPPSKEEKTEYWDDFKINAIVCSLLILPVITILGYIYLWYNYTTITMKYTSYALLIIMIIFTILSITSLFSTLYFQIYESWHMTYKRYRFGYYSSLMDGLTASIFLTVVAFVFLYFMYKLPTESHLKITIFAVTTILSTISHTTYLIVKFRKEKPSLPPITEQEHENHEFLKELYFHVLETEIFHHLHVTFYEIDYLATLDCYMNYGFYDNKQVEDWKHNLKLGNLTIADIFREMTELVRMKDKKLYLDICEKARKEMKRLKKKPNIIRNKIKLKEHFGKYLD